MSDWADGYIHDIAYTHGFYREQTPALLNLALTLGGFEPPPLDRPFRYCELGSGQGVTVNILAAANPAGEFWATDFNPSHAAGAAQLAASGGLANIRCLDLSFQDFLKADTPQFDYIALHGIYSWISPENRKAIVDVISAKLRVGGVVYISYNALPGWAAAAPLQRLFAEFGEGTDSSDRRVEKAIAFIEKLRDAKAAYFNDNPSLAGKLDRTKTMPRAYLAHEYMNGHWHPLYFSDVARELGAAKLRFAVSAHLGDHMDNVSLPQAAQSLLAEIPDPMRRQQVRDYVLNQQFRRDVFVKGAVQLNGLQRQAAVGALRIALLRPKSKVGMELRLPVGVCKLKREVYDPILEMLARKPCSLLELTQAMAGHSIDPASVIQAAIVLLSTGDAAAALPEGGEADRRKQTDAFNVALLERALVRDDINCLASPVTGSGMPIGRLEALMLLARRHGADPVRFVWQALAPQNLRLTSEGKTLQGEAENLAELAKRAKQFEVEQLPVLQTLGIA